MKASRLILSGVFALGSLVHAGPNPPASPSVLGTLVDLGGYRVHLYCTGQGSPTVVVASGGFSFDWGLIQPPIAKTTRICTYDTAGTAWSDTPEEPLDSACSGRVSELQRAAQESAN